MILKDGYKYLATDKDNEFMVWVGDRERPLLFVTKNGESQLDEMVYDFNNPPEDE